MFFIAHKMLEHSLCLAIDQNDINTVKNLLTSNVSANSHYEQDLKKIYAIQLAVKNQNDDTSILELLIEFGANLNILDDNDLNLLMLACSVNNYKCFKKLLEYNTDINFINKEEVSVLSLVIFNALKFNNLNIFRSLINQNNLNISRSFKNKDTYLHEACDNFQLLYKKYSFNSFVENILINIIRHLIFLGIDPDQLNDYNEKYFDLIKDEKIQNRLKQECDKTLSLINLQLI